ncbi:MAG: ABC transporter substrate-binding protein [Chloroflexota bacterium]
MTRQPLSRRRFLQFSALAAVPLLSACSSQPAAAPAATPAPAGSQATAAAGGKPAATATIKRGGSLVSAKQWTYASLDPALTSEPEMSAYESLYNALVRFELVDAKSWEFKVVPDLAESWEQPDPKTIVFKLKKGVTFHDGSEFDAEVAKWNILRYRDHPKSQLNKANLKAAVDDVEAPDKTTLRIKLKTESPSFMRMSAFAWGSKVRMYSKAAADKNGEDWMQRNAVGTGPFKLKQWVTDDRVIMERNPNYFEKGADGKALPYLDEYVARYIPDPTVALNDMRAGSLHILEWIQTKDLAAIKSDANLGVWEMPWAGQIYFFGGYNTKAKPFDDLRVRQAANYAIDREAMAKALGYGVGQPFYYPQWGPGVLGNDDGILKYKYNPDKAKQLLKEAGYADGTISIELKIIAREPEQTIGEFMQSAWSAAGIKTKMVSMERLAWIDQVRAGNFQACFWRGNLATAVVDPDALKLGFNCGAPGNWAQWCDQDVDKIMVEAGSTMDVKKREELYKKVFTRVQEQAYLFTGIGVPLLTAYRKEVQNLDFDFQSPVCRGAWLNK